MKRVFVCIIAVVAIVLIGMISQQGCSEYTAAEIASQNLSKDADEFKIPRRISFYNGITDKVMLKIEGNCSLEFFPEKFVVVCKVGKHEFTKHYLGRSDNAFPIVEQLEGVDVSTFHHKVIYRPQALIPDIDIKASGEALKDLITK